VIEFYYKTQITYTSFNVVLASNFAVYVNYRNAIVTYTFLITLSQFLLTLFLWRLLTIKLPPRKPIMSSIELIALE